MRRMAQELCGGSQLWEDIAVVNMPADIGQGIVDVPVVVTPTQRLGAVGWVVLKFLSFQVLEVVLLDSVALLGVCGATGACE